MICKFYKKKCAGKRLSARNNSKSVAVEGAIRKPLNGNDQGFQSLIGQVVIKITDHIVMVHFLRPMAAGLVRAAKAHVDRIDTRRVKRVVVAVSMVAHAAVVISRSSGE